MLRFICTDIYKPLYLYIYTRLISSETQAIINTQITAQDIHIYLKSVYSRHYIHMLTYRMRESELRQINSARPNH